MVLLTVLQEKGLKAGELPETWNILKADIVTQIHSDYIMAGCNVVETNTFGANSIKYPKASVISLDKIIESAVNNVKKAKEICKKQDVLIALDVGPTGKLLEPLGDLKFEEAVEVFAETIRIGVKQGVDIILIETMNDLYEVKAAVIAAKENSNLPIWVTCVFDENARMLTGTDPLAMVTLLEGLGVDVLGLNCSLSPDKMIKTVEEIKKYASIPIAVNPNAGLPKLKDGITYFESTPEEFAKGMESIAKIGVDILGGCCGTTPEHIKQMIEKVSYLKPIKSDIKPEKIVSCFKEAVKINDLTIIDRTIDLIKNEELRVRVLDGDLDAVIDEAFEILGEADMLELCLTLPEEANGKKEKEIMSYIISEMQGMIGIPIIFKTEFTEVLEYALRRYNGKAMVNLTFGLANGIENTISIIKKYGAEVDFSDIEDKKLIEMVKEKI